jgi:hypothetical protein
VVKVTKEEEKTQELERQAKISQIIETYAHIAEEQGNVSMNDLIDAGLTKDTVTYYFRNLKRLNLAAREEYPEKFHDTYLDDIVAESSKEDLADVIASYDRLLITSAVTGCRADSDQLASMKAYCEDMDAHILVLMSADPAHNKFAPGADYGTVDRQLVNDPDVTIVTHDIALNSNLCLSTIKLSAKQMDPAQSMLRLAQKTGSMIFASPKQRLKAAPVSNENLPHFVMTTGAITLPDYATDNYMSSRTATIADHDHVMGALVVEIVDNDIYHYRQIQRGEDGSIIDLGWQYNPDGSIEEVNAWLVMGDLHSGSIDPDAFSACEDITANIHIEKVILHDGFDGMSINHHERNNVLSRAKKADLQLHDLQKELVQYADVLDIMATEWEGPEEIVLVKSNHDEFLARYLEAGYYVKDPQNHHVALKLALAMLNGNDPLRYGIENEEIGGLKNQDKIRWLKRDEDFKRGGVQLGAHGDKGNNGARGSLRSMEQAYGQSVSGHSHSPEILRGAFQVGTTSKLKLGYNQGGSTWCHTSCLVYPDGRRQLVNIINGEWRM